MNTYELLKNITVIDVIIFVLFLMSLYLSFFTNYKVATMYITSVAMFFIGIGFIVDAIKKVKVINIITNETTLITSGKATIQE
jgi:hypothetical protein